MQDNFNFDEELEIEDEGDNPAVEDEEDNVAVEEPVATPVVTKSSTGLVDFSKIFNDFGPDLASVPGVVVGDVGLEVSRFIIDRAKFSKEKRDRIAFLTNKVIAVKAHYKEGLGSFLCFNGLCCQVADAPRVKYLVPVLLYDTDKKGKILSKDVTLKVLALGQDSYEAITLIQEANQSLTDIDVIVNCTDNDYQKLTFVAAGPVNWKKSRSISEYVAEQWTKVKGHLIDPIARVLTEKQLKERLTVDKGANAGVDLTMDDMFDD